MIYLIGSGKHSGVVEMTLNKLNYTFQNISKFIQGNDIDLEKKIRENKKKIHLHIAIGDNLVRKKVFNFFKKKGYTFTSIIDPSAITAKKIVVRSGVYIGPGVIINNNVKIEENCIINTGAIIEHDVQILANTHVAPGAKILGSVNVGENCLVGSGVVVNNNLKIFKNCTIGSGSVVTKNIKSSGIYVGVPAKKK